MPMYNIKSGDNLSRLAKRFGTTVSELAQANNITDPDKIFVGDSIEVPDPQANQLQDLVKSLLGGMGGDPQQMMGDPMASGLPPELMPPQGVTNRQAPMGAPQGPSPQQGVAQQVMPEAMMAGGPAMMRGAGNMAMGGLGALAKQAPRTAQMGRVAPPLGSSNVAPVGNSGAFNSSMAQAMLNSRGGLGHPASAVMRPNPARADQARAELLKQYGMMR